MRVAVWRARELASGQATVWFVCLLVWLFAGWLAGRLARLIVWLLVCLFAWLVPIGVLLGWTGDQWAPPF